MMMRILGVTSVDPCCADGNLTACEAAGQESRMRDHSVWANAASLLREMAFDGPQSQCDATHITRRRQRLVSFSGGSD